MLHITSLTYRTQRKPLISDISLSFSPGMLYGILGPNGSGKSTLLRTIMGICQPTAGIVCWQGESLLTKNRREIGRILSLVPQGIPLYFDFTVYDVVAMGRYSLGGKNNPLNYSVIEWALRQTQIWELRNQPVATLSSGERQLAYIARALATEAPVMLLDEPTANLDIKHQLDIWKLLKELAGNKNKVVIIANHDLQMTKAFCNQVAVLNQGRCIQMGSFAEIITPPVLQNIFGISPDYLY